MFSLSFFNQYLDPHELTIKVSQTNQIQGTAEHSTKMKACNQLSIVNIYQLCYDATLCWLQYSSNFRTNIGFGKICYQIVLSFLKQHRTWRDIEQPPELNLSSYNTDLANFLPAKMSTLPNIAHPSLKIPRQRLPWLKGFQIFWFTFTISVRKGALK